MTGHIIDGRAISKKVRDNVAKAVSKRISDGLSTPGLEVILVGDNPASATYVKHKQKACEEVGIRSHVNRLPADTTQQTLHDVITDCNNNPDIHGILLQLPLPDHLSADELLEHIDPLKDVDGFHPYNLGRLTQRRPLLRPCTPHGIMTLLKETGIELPGKHAVVVGASNIVGRPMALELLLAKCTVTICHRFTKHLDEAIRTADILVAAIGKPGIIQSEWIKPRATVIDVGFNRLEDGTISGDIDFHTAVHHAEWITPVPGGVGPMTVATLLENTLLAAELSNSKSQ